MAEYWFVLGRERLLSLAELHQLFPSVSFAAIGSSIASANVDLVPTSLIKQLGGTVKIAGTYIPGTPNINVTSVNGAQAALPGHLFYHLQDRLPGLYAPL